MQRFGLKEVFKVLMKYRGNRTQGDMFFVVFRTACSEYMTPNRSDISNYISEKKPLPKWIVDMYSERGKLISDIKEVGFTTTQLNAIVQELACNAACDCMVLSENEARRLAKAGEWTYQERIEFVADALFSAMHYDDRICSIDINEFALIDAKRKSKLPPVCEHFVGREDELRQLEGLVNENRVVYVCGEPGQGKTELVKKFLTEKKEATVLYLAFENTWKETVGKTWLVSDSLSENEEFRYVCHREALRNLEENDILFIDGANIPESEDGEMEEAIAEYRCKTIVTTRCRHEEARELVVGAMKEGALENLVRAIYPAAEKYGLAVKRIIKQLHNHTFAVRLAAHVMQSEVVTPHSLLWRLRKEGIKLSIATSLKFRKHGHPKKETFYGHIRLLYSMLALGDAEQELLRGLWLLPNEGAYKRNIMRWFGTEKADELSDLVEKGYVQCDGGNQIFLFEFARDVVEADLVPTGENCATIIKRLCNIGCSNEYYEENGLVLCKMIERAIDLVKEDCTKLQLCKAAFESFYNYSYYRGMVQSIEQMEEILVEQGLGGTTDDVALWINKLSYMISIGDEKKSDLPAKLAMDRALASGKEENRYQIIEVLLARAVILRDRHMYAQAYQATKKALELFEDGKVFLPGTQAVANASMAITCICMGKETEARNAIKRGGDLLEEHYDSIPPYEVTAIFIAAAIVYAKCGEIEQAKSTIRSAYISMGEVYGADKNVWIREHLNLQLTLKRYLKEDALILMEAAKGIAEESELIEEGK